MINKTFKQRLSSILSVTLLGMCLFQTTPLIAKAPSNYTDSNGYTWYRINTPVNYWRNPNLILNSVDVTLDNQPLEENEKTIFLKDKLKFKKNFFIGYNYTMSGKYERGYNYERVHYEHDGTLQYVVDYDYDTDGTFVDDSAATSNVSVTNLKTNTLCWTKGINYLNDKLEIELRGLPIGDYKIEITATNRQLPSDMSDTYGTCEFYSQYPNLIESKDIDKKYTTTNIQTKMGQVKTKSFILRSCNSTDIAKAEISNNLVNSVSTDKYTSEADIRNKLPNQLTLTNYLDKTSTLDIPTSSWNLVNYQFGKEGTIQATLDLETLLTAKGETPVLDVKTIAIPVTLTTKPQQFNLKNSQTVTDVNAVPTIESYMNSYYLDNKQEIPDSVSLITCTDQTGTPLNYDSNLVLKAGTYNLTLKASKGYYNTTSETKLQVPIIAESIINPTPLVSSKYDNTTSGIQSQLPKQVTLKTNNGDYTISNLNWTSDDFRPKTPGDFTFISTVTLPNSVTNMKSIPLEVVTKVHVAKPDIKSFSTSTSNKKLVIPYNTPLLDAIAQFDNKVSIVGEGGYNKTIEIPDSDWQGNYDKRTPNTYTLTQDIPLPQEYGNSDNIPLVLAQQVEVEKPNLKSAILEDTTDLAIETKDSQLNDKLVNKATLVCNGDYSEDLVLDNWSCPTYNESIPGTYEFTATTTLPQTMTNKNNISLTFTRKVIVKKATIKSINILDKNGNSITQQQSIIVPYDTSLSEVKDQLNTNVEVKLSNGETLTKTVDKGTITFNPTYNSKQPREYYSSIDLTDLFVSYMDESCRDELHVDYLVTVQKPRVTSATLVNDDGISQSNTSIKVEYNTAIDELQSLLPSKAKLILANGETRIVPLANQWLSQTYNPIKPDTYEVYNSFDASEYFEGTDNKLKALVTVDLPVFDNIEAIPTSLSVQPIYTKEEIQAMLPTSVLARGKKGFSEIYDINQTDWVSDIEDFKHKGSYLFTAKINLKDNIQSNEKEQQVDFIVNVGNYSVSDIEYQVTTTNAIRVKYNTSFENAKKLLVDSIDIELNNGETRKVKVSPNWECANYNAQQPGVYLANSNLELPDDINSKEINIQQAIVVEERNYNNVKQEDIPVLEYLYGTPKEVIVSDLVKSIILETDSGEELNYDVNTANWLSNYTETSAPGNYDFNNSVLYIKRDYEDYTGITTGNILNFEFTTSQTLKVDFSQQVKINHKVVTKLVPLDSSLPNTNTNKSISQFNKVFTELPRKFSLEFEDGSREEYSGEINWTRFTPNQSDLNQTLGFKIKLPYYAIGVDSLNLDLIFNPINQSTGNKKTKHKQTITSVEALPEVIPEQQEESKYNNISFIVNSENWYKDEIQQPTTLDTPPEIKASRLYIPVRYLAYALNIKESDIKWDSTNQKVYLNMSDGRDVEITINSNEILVNGKKEVIDGKPYLTNGRTMMPVSQICKVLLEDSTYSIKWIPDTLKVKLVFGDNTESDNTDYIDYIE